MNKTEFKKTLGFLPEQEKDKLLLKLFTNKECRKSIELYFGVLDTTDLYDKAIKKIDANIFGRSGIVLKKREAKKAISSYYKDTKDTEGQVKLMLYYVRRLGNFIAEYGGADESSYTSAEETFRKVTEIVDKVGRHNEFYELITETATSIIDFDHGWGFSDQVGDYYEMWLERNSLGKFAK